MPITRAYKTSGILGGATTNGETLVADSSASVGLRYSGANQQNPVINGAYEIWQRGTSFTSSGYTADRWYWNVYGISGRTLSRQVPGSTLPEFAYCARSARNSGNTATDPISLVNSFAIDESLRYAGKTVTLSFYARAGADYSRTDKGLLVYIVTGTGTSDVQRATTGYTNDNTSLNTVVTLTTSWQRFTYTATIPSTATQFCVYFQHSPQGTAGANDYFETTGVQIDLGSTALPFRRSGGTLAGELLAAQRYYWRNTATGSYTSFGNGYAATTTLGYFWVQHPVQMRVQPTALEWSGLGAHNPGSFISGFTTATLGDGGTRGNTISLDGAVGMTTYRPYFLSANNNSSAYIAFSAEL